MCVTLAQLYFDPDHTDTKTKSSRLRYGATFARGMGAGRGRGNIGAVAEPVIGPKGAVFPPLTDQIHFGLEKCPSSGGATSQCRRRHAPVSSRVAGAAAPPARVCSCDSSGAHGAVVCRERAF